ncbi:MAG TPA: nucleoside monophosphate kinase, partial [Thermoanaerobaculia bacterium]|nr:nucleoside monophosphate kinase [Thermoanaerobaculia bacterium]
DLDAVVLLEVPEEELVARMAGRGRADDGEEVVRERLRVYREKTEPLVGYYDERGALRPVDGVGSVEDVSARILEAIG